MKVIPPGRRGLLFMAVFFIAVLFVACEEDEAIVEPPVSVLEGVITDSLSGDLLGEAIVSRLLRAEGGDVYLQQAVTDTTGFYRVILGSEPLEETRWRFETAGYSPREFDLPADATALGDRMYRLDVPLVPE